MSTLNPNAESFVPQNIVAAREGNRSLYMTFSYGQPLTHREISNYFNGIYGMCVENVFIHKRRTGEPLSGNVTFTTLDLPRIILGNQEVVEVEINGKLIWLKKFVPRVRRSSA